MNTPIGLYQASLPPVARALRNLDGLLAKAAAHVEERKLDPSALLDFRLYPDMFPLKRQVQIASDVAKGCASRLAGREPPKYPDDETSFAELSARIARTLTHLEATPPEEIDGQEWRIVTLQIRGAPVDFSALDYLQKFVLPNVYFHCGMSYAILRHCCVVIGKSDFLGELP